MVPLTTLGVEAAAPPDQQLPPQEQPLPQPEQQLPPQEQQLPPQELLAPLIDAVNMTDAPRDYLSGKFVGWASDIDRFFGDDRNYQESNDSVFQLDITRVAGYSGERKFAFSGKAKVHLPMAEKNLHLLLETDPDKNTSTDPVKNQTALPSTRTAPASYGAGVRYEKVKEERWHFSADGGLKFQGVHTAPFVRARGSYAIPLEQWRLKASETAFWFNSTGIGETTQLDLERPISDPLMFRASSNATWLKSSHNFDLRQDFSIFHTVNERNALLYQASVTGVTRPQSQATDYVFLLLYRYRLHREWMFLELSPQLHFPKAVNYKSSRLLSFRLEMLFDNPK